MAVAKGEIMRRVVGAIGAVGVATAGMALAPPAMAVVDPGNGAASVTLTACAGPNNADTMDPACSYIYLTPQPIGGATDKPYTYITQPGAVAWDNGSVTSMALAFPASGQTWQTVTKLSQGATMTVQPSDITGSVDGNGVVKLTMAYNVEIALSYFGNQEKCLLTGTVDLSSAGTDTAGQGVGSNWNPATGAFAVAGTSTAPTPGTQCDGTKIFLFDLTKPMGFYFVGSMTLPPPDAPQTATVKVAKKVNKSGKTILMKKAVVTNLGQKATAKVSWSPKKSAKGKKAKYAKLTVKKNGKLILKTKGASKKLFVKLSLSAPSKPGYKAFSYTKVWKAK